MKHTTLLLNLFSLIFLSQCELTDPNGLIQPADVIVLDFDSTRVFYANGEDLIKLSAKLTVLPQNPVAVTFKTNYGHFAATGTTERTPNNEEAKAMTGIEENGTAVVYLITDTAARDEVIVSATVEGYSDFGTLVFKEEPFDPNQILALTLPDGSEVLANNDATIRLNVELLAMGDTNKEIIFSSQQGIFLNLNGGEILMDGRYKVMPNNQQQLDVYLKAGQAPNNEVSVTATQSNVSDMVMVSFLPSFPSPGVNSLSSNKPFVTPNGQDFATLTLNIDRIIPNEKVSNDLLVKFSVTAVDTSMASGEMIPAITFTNAEMASSKLYSVNGVAGQVEVKAWIEGWVNGDTLSRIITFQE